MKVRGLDLGRLWRRLGGRSPAAGEIFGLEDDVRLVASVGDLSQWVTMPQGPAAITGSSVAAAALQFPAAGLSAAPGRGLFIDEFVVSHNAGAPAVVAWTFLPHSTWRLLLTVAELFVPHTDVDMNGAVAGSAEARSGSLAAFLSAGQRILLAPSTPFRIIERSLFVSPTQAPPAGPEALIVNVNAAASTLHWGARVRVQQVSELRE